MTTTAIWLWPEQAALRGATETAARNVVAETNFRNDADFVVDNATPDAEFWTQYNETSTSYVAADTVAYAAYLSAVDSAAQAYADEQCRVTGLFYDAVDTGVNNIADGTGSLDVQVCFPAGFEIDLTNGTTKKIEEFEGGEEVWARPHNDPTAPLQKCKVIRAFKNEPKETIKIVFDNDLELQATAEHPFYVPERGWVSCEKLAIGDICVNRDGDTTKVVSKKFVVEKVPVYNIEVDGAHTYYVGKNGKSVLVHNECVWYWIEKGLAGVQIAGEFVAGGADSFSFGLTKFGREGIWPAEYSDIEYRNVYIAGEVVEIGAEVVLTGGSAWLKKSAQAAIKKRAAEIVAQKGAQNITEAAAEKLAKEQIESALRKKARKIVNPKPGEVVHHSNPLLGHPPMTTTRPIQSLPGIPRNTTTVFPTLGCPAWANHGSNLQALSPLAHKTSHQLTYAADQLFIYSINPATTSTRTMFDFWREFSDGDE